MATRNKNGLLLPHTTTDQGKLCSKWICLLRVQGKQCYSVLPQRDTGIMNKIAVHVLKNIEQGESTTCSLALNPKVEGVSGGYFTDNNKVEASELARDSELAKKLWDYSLNLTDPK